MKAQLPNTPPNLPDVNKHPVILVDGLQAWFATLPRAHVVLFLRYLYDFDIDQHSPTPDLFLRATETSKLLCVYDMSSTVSKADFVKMVKWKGTETDPEPPHTAADASLTCYAAAVVPTSRPAMIKCLGPNPWAPSIAAYLLDRPGEWSNERLQLSWGHAAATPGGPAYTQGHLEPSGSGMRIRDIIPLLAGWMRVGATGDKLAIAMDNVEIVANQVPTVFDVLPKAPSMTLRLSMFARVSSETGMGWSPFKTPAFVLMLGPYESVRLESAVFQISVPAGQGNEGYAAVVSAGTSLAGPAWYGAPVLKRFPGSDSGAVMGTFTLPDVHSWNKELRATVRGNYPPEFKFGLTGPAGVKMTVTGQFTVSVSGQSVMGGFEATAGGKFTSSVRSIQNSLSYSVADTNDRPMALADDSEEESDDDDDAAPATASNNSPRASAAPAGSSPRASPGAQPPRRN